MRICLYGGPGSGKSTTAAWLFSALKEKGHYVELIPEAIKPWAWAKRAPESFDQFYLFATQLHYEDRILRLNTHIVTDAPLPMQLAFASRDRLSYTGSMVSMCKQFEDKYPSINIFLARTVEYQTAGRYETLIQAKQLDEEIGNVLVNLDIPFIILDPQTDRSQIFEYVQTRLQ